MSGHDNRPFNCLPASVCCWFFFKKVWIQVRSPTRGRTWSGSKMFETPMVFPKAFWQTVSRQAYDMQNYLACKELVFVWFDSLRTSQQFFQLCQDGPSWVDPVLSKNKCVLLKVTARDATEARTRDPSVSSQALSHCAPIRKCYLHNVRAMDDQIKPCALCITINTTLVAISSGIFYGLLVTSCEQFEPRSGPT